MPKTRSFSPLWAVASIALLSFSARAQYVELTVQVETYDWEANEPASTWTARCLVDPHSWLIEGKFSRNARNTWWFSGSSFVGRTVITDLISDNELKRFARVGFPVLSPPPIGQQFTRTEESSDGNPGKPVREADLMTRDARICWLAFCTTPALLNTNRHLFPPNDLWKQMVSAPAGFVERKERFDDSLGLLKSLDLYLTNQIQPILRYRVTGTTNVLGWTVPMEFYLAQYRPVLLAGSNRFNSKGWELDFSAKAKLTSIRIGPEQNLASAAADVSVASVLEDWEKLGTVFDRPDRYGEQIRQLVQIGSPAVPALIDALDRSSKDVVLRLLAFTLRAIGDPRAVPALIRAFPRTLLPPGSDCALSVTDPALLTFLQSHDLDEAKDPNGFDRGHFSMGRPVREVAAALRKITQTHQTESEVFLTFFEGGLQQRASQRKAYDAVARRWADWWQTHARERVNDPAFAEVNLPAPMEEPVWTRFTTGPKIKVTGGMSGVVVHPLQDGGHGCALALSLNRKISLPPLSTGTNQALPEVEAVAAWAARAGADLLGCLYQDKASGRTIYAARTLGLQAWEVPNDHWDRIEQEVSRDALPTLDAPAAEWLLHYDPDRRHYDPETKATFLFITRDGTQGIVRITPRVATALASDERPAAAPENSQSQQARTESGVELDYRVFYSESENEAAR